MTWSQVLLIEDGTSLICIYPSINVLSILGKKYTVLVMGVIGNKNGKRNFNDIPKPSSNMISKKTERSHGIQHNSK